MNEVTTRQAIERHAYTVDEFCEAHRISRSQAYEHISGKQGPKLKTRKSGRKTIILVDDARAWRESLPEGGSE